MPSKTDNLASKTPDQFLLWWFDNAERHGLAADYKELYRNYADRPDAIPYVWAHYQRRLSSLAAVVRPIRCKYSTPSPETELRLPWSVARLCPGGTC